MKLSLVLVGVITASADDLSAAEKSTALVETTTAKGSGELKPSTAASSVQLSEAKSDQTSSEHREILPVREYVSQQILHALQGRGLDDWVIALEKTLAGAVANTQSVLWRNDLVESLNRQREQIRRRVDTLPSDQVPSMLSPIPRRAKYAWNGRLSEDDGSRLPSFADLLADTWADTVKDSVNLPIMGPFNPALWKPEEVAEVLGPILNMIPHETAKLLQHRDEVEGAASDGRVDDGSTWLEFLDFSEGSEDAPEERSPLVADALDVIGVSEVSRPPAAGGIDSTVKVESEIPGFGHLMMDDKWHEYRVSPTLLDLPLLGPLNPSQQLAAALPPVYLPYRALRMHTHAPEWLNLEGLNAMMPANAYTPKDDAGNRERRPLPVYSLLRGAVPRRRLEAAPSKTWREQISESRVFRSILHYLPLFGKEAEAEEAPITPPAVVVAEAAEPLNRNLASSNASDSASAAVEFASENDFVLEGKRYYRASAEEPVPNELRDFDI